MFVNVARIQAGRRNLYGTSVWSIGIWRIYKILKLHIPDAEVFWKKLFIRLETVYFRSSNSFKGFYLEKYFSWQKFFWKLNSLPIAPLMYNKQPLREMQKSANNPISLISFSSPFGFKWSHKCFSVKKTVNWPLPRSWGVGCSDMHI